MESEFDVIEVLNPDIPLFLVKINDHIDIYDGKSFTIARKLEDSVDYYCNDKNMRIGSFYESTFEFCSNGKSSRYILTKDRNYKRGLLGINGKKIIPNCFKHIDYNDNYVILDGYIIPFEFSKNSNLKLSFDDIFYYNVKIYDYVVKYNVINNTVFSDNDFNYFESYSREFNSEQERDVFINDYIKKVRFWGDIEVSITDEGLKLPEETSKSQRLFKNSEISTCFRHIERDPILYGQYDYDDEATKLLRF